MTADFTETYQFAPAWFKRIGDGSIREGFRIWVQDPFFGHAPNDEEDHTYLFVEGVLLYALIDFILLFLPWEVPSQLEALRVHEAAHEPVLGAEYDELEDEGRSEDGGLVHVSPEGHVDLKVTEVPHGDIMVRRGLRTSDERGLTVGYRKLDISRGIEVR